MPGPTQPNDNTQSGDQAGGDQGGDQNQNAGAQSQTATTTPPASGDDFDATKLSGDQLEKVLENKELWKHPRIAELLESQKQLKKLQTEKEKADEKSLKEDKKFEELAEKRGKENETLQAQLKERDINQALTVALTKENVVDLDGALKLVDRSALDVDDKGSVTGVDTAVESLKTDKSYLFNSAGAQNKPPTIGAASGSGDQKPSGPMKFKRSQLRDPAFYAANRTEILEAQKAGLIEDDISEQ